MQNITLKLHNLTEVPARERYVAAAEAACGRARRWAASAVDAGLPGLLRPQDDGLLEGLREQVRRREVLSPEFAVDAMALAGVCSQRIGERELGGWGVEALSEQAVELHALAEAVDAVLDLGEALRALEWIASAPAPRTLERRIGATIEAGR